MEGKKNYFILIAVIAALALCLTILTGYLLMVQTSSPSAKDKIENGEDIAQKRPHDNELGFKKLFEEEQFFNLKSEQTQKPPIIVINIQLQYYKKIKGIKNVEEKIARYESSIKELVGTYFQSLSRDDVMNIETKVKAKEELRQKINELLSKSEDEPKDIIYEIVFDKWFYQ